MFTVTQLLPLKCYNIVLHLFEQSTSKIPIKHTNELLGFSVRNCVFIQAFICKANYYKVNYKP